MHFLKIINVTFEVHIASMIVAVVRMIFIITLNISDSYAGFSSDKIVVDEQSDSAEPSDIDLSCPSPR